MNLTTSRELLNAYSVKRYSDDYLKLVLHKVPIRQSGFENDREQFNTYDEKLDSSISRTRSKVFEYAICNDFDYFVTLTLNKDKHDRYDLDGFISSLGQFIRNYRTKYQLDIQYLLIPEKHKDGAWHMHGLIKGLNLDHLIPFTLEDKIPEKIKNLIRAGRTIFNWIPYSEKFGWITVEQIKSREACSKYITKYIKKDIGTSIEDKNKKSYYVTRGLKSAEIIKKGTFPTELGNVLSFDYENEYLKIVDLNKKDWDVLSDIL